MIARVMVSVTMGSALVKMVIMVLGAKESSVPMIVHKTVCVLMASASASPVGRGRRVTWEITKKLYTALFTAPTIALMNAKMS